MRHSLFIAGFLLLALGQASATDDVIGVFADPAGTQSAIMAETGVPFDIYLVILSLSDASGVYAFELKMNASPNVTFSNWSYSASGENLFSPPTFTVAYLYPLPQSDSIVLCSAQCTLDDDGPGYIYLAPADICSIDPPDLFCLPGDLERLDEPILLESTAPTFEDPVFTIRNCAAENDWSLRSVSGPPHLIGYGMAYDSQNDVTVMFGGRDEDGQNYDETWLWDGSTWTQAFPALSPPAHAHHGMVYDESRNRVVMFGGKDTASLEDTWEWDGSNWSWAGSGGPGARFCMGFTYDKSRQVCVLYAGNHDAGRWADTWERDGASWSHRSSTGPGNRSFHAMAYDDDLGEGVMFGGQKPGNVFKSDTWTWNGTSWTQHAVSGPSARTLHSMAYHGHCGGVYLYGGQDASGVYGDVWKFQDDAWTQEEDVADHPGPRRYTQMVFDDQLGVLMFYGGMNESGYYDHTWFYGAGLGIVLEVETENRTPMISTTVSSYPNPFNPQTTIRFGLRQAGPVELTVYNLKGMPIKTLVAGVMERGEHEVRWDGSDRSGARVASGTYLYQLKTGEGVHYGKMAVLK